jgi:MFS family permease
MPLRQVVIFNLVPRSLAPNAVAFMQTAWALMRSFGPGLGGFLILWIGAGGNFLVQAGAFVLIAVNILIIRFPPWKPGTARNSPLQNIREGLRYVAKERTTETFIMMGWILPLLIIPIFSVLPPVYARDVFHGGPEILGYLLSSVGVGGIIGGIFTASMSQFERRGLLQLGALLCLSLSLIGFAFCTTFWVALLISAVAGFFEIIFLTTNQTLLQLSIPNEIRGRVTAVVNLNGAISPLGGLLAGAGSDLFGGPKWITVIMCSLAGLVAIGVFIFSSTVRNYRMSQNITASPANTMEKSGEAV